jgi:uncharacterized protein YodC (DUF2158 family)
MKCKPGLLVMLKSGGPDMTVESVGADGVVCVWFDGKRRSRETFQPEVLKRKPSGPTKITFTMPGGRKLPGDPSN